MKLKHLLLLLCLFVTGIGQMRATDEITSGQSYYIQNVESGLFLCGANNWGTRASVSVQGQLFTVTESGGVYTLINQSISTSIAEANRKLGYNLFTDADPTQNGNTWTITPVDGKPGVFTIYGQGKAGKVEDAFNGYLSQSNTAGAHIGYLAEGVNPATNASEWRFLTEQEAKAQLLRATASNGMSASFLIENANFSRNHNASTLSKNNEGVVTITNSGPWKIDEGCTNANLAGGGNDNHCAESYHSKFHISQTLTGIPNGVYGVTAQGFCRIDDNGTNTALFFANDITQAFPLKTGSENSMSDASNSFSNAAYTIDEMKVTVTNGTLEIGVKNDDCATLWCIWDNFNLTYYGFEDDTNVTSCIVNPSFESNNMSGWTDNSASGMWTMMTRGNAGDPKVGSYWVEKYSKSGKIDLSQTISNLPRGLYRVSVLALDQASKTKLIAKTSVATMETPIVGGTATRYTVDIMLDGQSDLTIGLYCENHNTNSWVGFDDFHLTYVSSSYPELTAVVGKMNADVATAQTSALNQYNTEKTVANYKDAVDAIAAAQASKEHYEAAAIALPNQKALIDGTNVYAAGWLTGYVANYNSLKEKYDNNTLNEEEVVNPNAFTGWHASTAYNDLLTPWTFGGEACNKFDKALDINTWSQEGDTDGSNFQVPFFEYWVTDAEQLQNQKLAATLTGLENGLYSVTAWVRVRATNDVAATDATGITLSVNGGTPVDATEGAQVGTSQLTLAEVTAEGPVSNGTLNIAFDINETNISWLAFKNVKYTKVRDLTQEELDYQNALAAAKEVKTVWAGKVGGVFQHTTEAYDAVVAVINDAEATSTQINAAVAAFNNSKVEPSASKYYRIYLAQDGGSTGFNLNAFNGREKNLRVTSTPYAVKIVPVNQGYNIRDVYDNNIVHAKNSSWIWGTANADWDSNGGARGERFTSQLNDNGTVTLTSAYASISIGANGFTDGSSVGRNTNIQWLVEETEITEATMAINATAQYGTFVAPYANILPEDVIASTVIVNNEGMVELTELVDNTLPANTPVLVYKEGGLSATMFKGIRVDNEVQVKVDNLIGNLTDSPVLIPNSNETATNYVLQLHGNSVGFYKVGGSDFTVGTNRCYLTVPVSSENARDFFLLDGEETSISTVATDELKDGKLLVNGQIVIVKGGVKYNTAGLRIK